MQNVMRIARAISKRRPESSGYGIGDLAEAFHYVDFVDRRSLGVLCRWLGIEAACYGQLRSGGQQLVAEGLGLIIPLERDLREKMEGIPFALENIVGTPSDGDLDAQAMERWVLASELSGQGKSKLQPNTVPSIEKTRPVIVSPPPPRSLRTQLAEVVFGQDDVLAEVVNALAEREGSLPTRPLVMLAAGPGPSGKTLLGNALAAALPGHALRSFEMSAYLSHNDFGLTGLRYGYTDAHPGELTSFVRHNPRAIIVFENIDRAHPVIQNTLVPAVTQGVLRDQYWAGLGDRGKPGKSEIDDGLFGSRERNAPAGVADPDVSFRECILIFTTSQGEAAHELPIYNDRHQMCLAERSAMLLEALRASDDASERQIAPGLLNALGERLVLPFRRLDTPSLGRLAQARLREAVAHWHATSRRAVRVENMEQMAELFMLSLGHRASPRTLTTKAAADFLFPGVSTAGQPTTHKRLVIGLDRDSCPAYAGFRETLGADPVLTLFRKRQVVVCTPKRREDDQSVFLWLGDFRTGNVKSAVDFAGQGGFQVEMPDIGFSDVLGHELAKARLRQTAKLLRKQHQLASLGVSVPRGVLLYGPPGTGKTLLAKAFSSEADMPFVAVTGTEMMDPDFVRKLFIRLRRYAPATLFIDEVDALGRRGQSALGDAVINQLLAEIDGFAGAVGEPVFVIAATNYPEKLDAALVRSGRIDVHIEVPVLDAVARRQFLERYRRIPGLSAMNIERALNLSGGMSGADLEKARREIVLEMNRCDLVQADEAMVLAKLNELKYGKTRDVECSPEELARNAFHEAGHAVLGQLLFPEQIIERVSIEIRGDTLGGVSFVSDRARVDNLDAELVQRRLCMLLAGRAAEMRQFGRAGCNAGATGDIQQATELASRAVLCWGLDETVGMLMMASSGNQVPAISAVPEWAVARIRVWIDGAFAQAGHLLCEHWNVVERVAEQLLERRTLGGGEWQEFWGSLTTKRTSLESIGA